MGRVCMSATRICVAVCAKWSRCKTLCADSGLGWRRCAVTNHRRAPTSKPSNGTSATNWSNCIRWLVGRVPVFGITSSNTICLTTGFTMKATPASVVGLAPNALPPDNTNGAAVGTDSRNRNAAFICNARLGRWRLFTTKTQRGWQATRLARKTLGSSVSKPGKTVSGSMV